MPSTPLCLSGSHFSICCQSFALAPASINLRQLQRPSFPVVDVHREMPYAILNRVAGKSTRPRIHARRRQLRTSALSRPWPSLFQWSSMWQCWRSLPRGSTAKASQTSGWRTLPTTWAMHLGPTWYVPHASHWPFCMCLSYLSGRSEASLHKFSCPAQRHRRCWAGQCS